MGIGVAVLFSSMEALAQDSGFYLKLSYGFANIKNLKTTAVEKRLFSEKNVTGSFMANSRSNPFEAGVGYNFSKYVALEILREDKLQAKVRSRVGYSGSIGGLNVNTNLYELERYGRLSGYSVNLVGKIKVYGPFDATATVSVMYAEACLGVRSPQIPYGIEAISCVEGLLPSLGAGLNYNFDKFTLSGGSKFYGRHGSVRSISGQYRF